MPRKRLSMRKIREVLRLRWQCNATQREISVACNIGQSTVSDYLQRSEIAGLSWPLPADLTEADLDAMLFPKAVVKPSECRPVPEWPWVREELRKKGVTLLLLWQEYERGNPAAYRYSWFSKTYRAWEAKAYPRLRLPHIPGDKVYVDYAGQTVLVTDRLTGKLREAQIYVATLGASNYTYAEATWTQGISDWLASNTRALEYFRGVPRAIVPDNLKSGVKSANYYEPDINEAFMEWAAHYGVAVLPARVRTPKDKSKVENGVQQVERWILAALRNRSFFSLDELNRAIRELLEQLNTRETKGLPASRKVMFETTDLPALSPLPSRQFQRAEWLKATVHLDYHVDVQRHFYSVPHTLIGQEVDVRIDVRTVEIFHKGVRVASHARSSKSHACTTIAAHRPPNHAAVLGSKDQWLCMQAQRIGAQTHALVQNILASVDYPEQGYRRCLGIVRLAREHGAQTMERASAAALEENTSSYRRVSEILRTLLRAPAAPEAVPVRHDNIRGSEYYLDSDAQVKEKPQCSRTQQ